MRKIDLKSLTHIFLVSEPSGYHSAATLNRENTLSVYSEIEPILNSSEDSFPHLHHVDDMIWQPEEAKRHHNSQDEFLAANIAAELVLPQAFQDEHVAGDDDGIWKDEA